jgi:hypothetical protein
MNETAKLLHIIKGVHIYQYPNLLITYVADLSDDVDGAPHSYRLDNNSRLALDDIHASAGWPNGSWTNVLVPDPTDPHKPYVDNDGFCVSMTSYQREGYEKIDRRRYLDATKIPYIVAPGIVRKLCRGILLGCKASITRTTDGKTIEGVTGDFSGYSIGEASDFVCKFFDPNLSARNGDERRIYEYKFYPNQPARVGDEQFNLIPA